ncbi:hypothetical protein POTOM_031069 [Populus tomentosa]|uniref:Uncharacterized protein n=1 Tax=Populus tomentosa TaxID=118781 RepID=A0A8X7ZBZ8_POPTO|nr:hypothetical protein POTOM_031069 [Populus tomentosa]
MIIDHGCHACKWESGNRQSASLYFIFSGKKHSIQLHKTLIQGLQCISGAFLFPDTSILMLGGWVCAKAVAKGFRCVFSNQGFWYLDRLDAPRDDVYKAELLEGKNDTSMQELVIGGEVLHVGRDS